jgi:hypothetical protein
MFGTFADSLHSSESSRFRPPIRFLTFAFPIRTEICERFIRFGGAFGLLANQLANAAAYLVGKRPLTSISAEVATQSHELDL